MSKRPDRAPNGPPARIDPDPLTPLLPVLATLAGILATMARAQWNAPARVRARIVTSSGRLRDDLRRMQADLEILNDVVTGSPGAPSLPFEIGNRLLLTGDEFRRYREATTNLMTYATRCVRRVHEIEASITAELFGPEVIHRPLALAADIQGQLNGILGHRDVTVGSAISVLTDAMDNTQELLRDLESQLRG